MCPMAPGPQTSIVQTSFLPLSLIIVFILAVGAVYQKVCLFTYLQLCIHHYIVSAPQASPTVLTGGRVGDVELQVLLTCLLAPVGAGCHREVEVGWRVQ